ncbi:hypothetical protein [Pseudomonas lundensis]|uniref:hypothetical protein n=1 Tax=Pseudomonas lundensis TaxID=86185 RepID=UPI00148382C5|nr:hypothetical protein [Pseudomonas lundensis]
MSLQKATCDVAAHAQVFNLRNQSVFDDGLNSRFGVFGVDHRELQHVQGGIHLDA